VGKFAGPLLVGTLVKCLALYSINCFIKQLYHIKHEKTMSVSFHQKNNFSYYFNTDVSHISSFGALTRGPCPFLKPLLMP